MDIHGNDPNGDIFGNSSSTAWGTPTDVNVWGDRPTDVFGNLSSDSADAGGGLLDTFLDAIGGLFGG